MSFLKTSLDGLNGAGKSGTAVRLAVGISKEFCNSAPVLVSDSEERWRFYKVNIFDVEKVPLIICPGKSVVDVQKAMRRGEKEGACVTVNDQLTTPWMNGVAEFSYANGTLPFERRQQLMNQWEPIVELFRFGKFHSIACGRLGYNWQNVEDENGDMQLVQGDSKFNAGGGNNFGYEADLELEMRRKKSLVADGKKFLGSIFKSKLAVTHLCSVVKDGTDSGILGGQQFAFPSQTGRYKPGDYKPVLDAFREYIEFLQKVDAPQKTSLSARDLIVSGKTDWAKDQSVRKGYIEEMDNLLNHCFPGGEKRSKLDAMYRNLTLEYLNGFSSWSRMEEETKTADLKRNVEVLKKLRARFDKGERPTDQPSLAAVLHLSTDDVLKPGHNMTLLEVMGVQSVKKANGKAQPIVNSLDYTDPDEKVI